MYMLYLFDLLWETICGKRENIKQKIEKPIMDFAYIEKVKDYNTILCDDDDISDYGQYVELDGEYYYDGCKQRGCEWCSKRYEMEG